MTIAKKHTLSLAILAGALASAGLIFSGNAPSLLARASGQENINLSESALAAASSKADAKASSGLDFSGGDIGSPAQTTGAGTRGPEACVSQEGKPLIPLMPAKKDSRSRIFNPSGLLFYLPQKTAAASPTLFFYVPEHNAQKGDFVLVDEEGNDVYWSLFDLPDTPGFIKLSLPETVELKVGQEYKWFLAIVCDPKDRSADYFLRGDLQRTELSRELTSELERESDTLARAKLFAKAGIWYETLELVARARQEEPEAWADLLKSAGLKDFAEEPILDCCTLENE